MNVLNFIIQKVILFLIICPLKRLVLFIIIISAGLWIYPRKRRLVCGIEVMSSWDMGSSEMKVQGALRPGLSLESTKENVIRILRVQLKPIRIKGRKEKSKIRLRIYRGGYATH